MLKCRLQHGANLSPLVWQIYLLFFICGIFAASRLVSSLCAAAIFLCLGRRILSKPRLLAALAIFCCAFSWTSWKLEKARHAMANAPEWLTSGTARITGVIHSTQNLPDNRLRIFISDLQPENLSAPPVPGLCVWTWDSPTEHPLQGQRIILTRPVQPNITFANEKDSPYQIFLIARNTLWRTWSKENKGNPQLSGKGCFLARARHELEEKFIKALLGNRPDAALPQSKAILLALIFGDRQFLSQSTTNNFSSAALAHSLALSGQHLGIALLLSLSFLFIIGKINPRLFLARPKKILAICAAMPIAVLYLWLGNAPSSLIRAFCMLLAAFIWTWKGAIFTGIDVLAMALALILAVQPLAAYDTGLQLSAVCVFVIIITWPAVNQLINHCAQKITRAQTLFSSALAIFLVSFLIQLILLPLNLLLFQNPGFWFPLNLFWLPALGLIVLPLSIAGLILGILPGEFSFQCAALVLDLAALPCSAIITLLQNMANHGLFNIPCYLIPHWTCLAAFLLVFIGTALFILKENVRFSRHGPVAIICCGLIFFAIGPLLRLCRYLDPSITIEACDVGQGQAIALTLPQGMRLLIDGGGAASTRFDPGKTLLAPLLAANSSPTISAVFNTHPDIDHAGGLIHILDHFSVNWLFHNGRSAHGRLEKKWEHLMTRNYARALAQGDRIYLGNPHSSLWLDVLWPPTHEKEQKLTGNAASLVLRLVYKGEGIAIFTGDAEKNALEKTLQESKDINAHVVFAPHHGSDKNLLNEFYRQSRPELVIASCGFQNRYHYPGKKLKALLQKMQIPLLDTGNHGKIIINIKDGQKPVWHQTK